MRRSISPALVLSALAIVLALTGTAVAGSYIITSKNQIKPSVRKALKGNRGYTGYQGDPGDTGAQGIPGPVGPVGLAHVVIAQGSTTLCGGTSSCSVSSVQATCPAGTKPFSGGVLTDSLNGTWAGTISTSNGYVVGGDNYGSGSTADLTAFAYCSTDVASVQFPNGTIGRSKLDRMAAARLASRAGG